MRWLQPIFDPKRAVKGLRGYLYYLRDLFLYRRIPGAESILLSETYPQVYERSPGHSIDAHYYYANGWALRRILSENPDLHVDLASQAIFSNALGASLPVVYLDYRALRVDINLDVVQGNVLELPFANGSIKSISCLHVVEHIGLGRYGDQLDPEGTRKAIRELARVTAVGGTLLVAVPVGRHRVCFNAHRVFSPKYLPDLIPDLILDEFSAVSDEGRYIENARLSDFDESDYACGLYRFRKEGIT